MNTHRIVSLIPLAAVAVVSTVQAQAIDRATASPDKLVRAAVEGVITTIQSNPRRAAVTWPRSPRWSSVPAVHRFPAYHPAGRRRSLEGRHAGAAHAAPPAVRSAAGAQLCVSLSQLRDQNVKFRYQPAQAAQGPNDVVVQTRVMNNGDEMQIDYRLQRTPSGWRIYDNQYDGGLADRGLPQTVRRHRRAQRCRRPGQKYLINHNAKQAADA